MGEPENVGHGLRLSVQLEICEGRTMQLFVAFYPSGW